ncbi:MAG: helix-turn-helix transcriptional regulator [Pirellulaceae bacterium]
MSLQLETPNEFPLDAFRALLQASPDQQDLIRRYMECSEEIQRVVRSMFVVLETPDISSEDRYRAMITITEALYLNPEEWHGNYGLDLAKIEGQTATEFPDPHRRLGIAKRLSQLDSQEATFSERLRQLLDHRNITQEELAERIGCTQSAISKMLSRNARPHRKTIFKMATALGVEPTDLWPDLEVAAILDSIAEFPGERELTQAQAEALEAASNRPPVKVEVRDLPTRRGK